MNYKVEIQKIIDVQDKFIPIVADAVAREQATHENIKSIIKELKKINYRLDRIRSDLKLGKDNRVMSEKELKESIDVSNSGGTDNGCKEPSK